MKISTIKFKLLWLVLFIFPTVIFAAAGHIYLGGSLGTSLGQVSNYNPQFTYYYGFITDSYPVQGGSSSASIFGINGGYEFLGSGLKPAIALGLGFYGTEHYNYNGQLVETIVGGPDSTLFNYNFHINSTRLMAEAQFTWLIAKLAPFINLGVGSAWNHLGGYTEIPADSSGYVILPPFQSQTNNNFAYQAGFGVSYGLNFFQQLSEANFQHDRISLGYRYVNLGNASFGIRNSIYPFKLDMGRFSTDELYLNYTHLF